MENFTAARIEDREWHAQLSTDQIDATRVVFVGGTDVRVAVAVGNLQPKAGLCFAERRLAGTEIRPPPQACLHQRFEIPSSSGHFQGASHGKPSCRDAHGATQVGPARNQGRTAGARLGARIQDLGANHN